MMLDDELDELYETKTTYATCDAPANYCCGNNFDEEIMKYVMNR